MKRASAIFTPNLRTFLLSCPKLNPNPNPLISSLTARFSGYNFFSSDSESSEEPNFANAQKPESATDDFDVVSKEELRKQIQRLNEGDEDAIPDIFESILKRKLAGIDKDDDLMDELVKRDDGKGIEDEEFISDYSDSDEEV